VLKILDSYGVPEQIDKFYKDNIKRCNNIEYRVDCINHRKKLNIKRAWSPQILDDLFRRKDPILMKYYQYIFDTCDQYDVFIVNHENVYHPEFIKDLGKKIYTVLYTGDDPEGSYGCSVPYVWAFDHVFCYAVYYNEKTRMTDKLKEWGAKRSDLRPYGYENYIHDASISEIELFSKKRGIDLIYVGGPYNKIDNLLKLKKLFGESFKLYGNWGGWKSNLSRLKRYHSFTMVNPLPQEQFVSTYQNTRIGINMHMSYGPSNLRMWQLPINGVMQITDNPEGVKEFFEIDKEIVTYQNNNFDEAIEKIVYYLDNPIKAEEIARAGYRKVKEFYSFESNFYRAMDKIIKGIEDKNG